MLNPLKTHYSLETCDYTMMYMQRAEFTRAQDYRNCNFQTHAYGLINAQSLAFILTVRLSPFTLLALTVGFFGSRYVVLSSRQHRFPFTN